MVGLAALVVLRGPVLAGVAIIVMVGMLWLSRPFHRRAVAWIEEDEVVGSRLEVAFGRGTRRDRMLRSLMYGDGPMRDALRLAGMPSQLIVLRGTIVVGTVAPAACGASGFMDAVPRRAGSLSPTLKTRSSNQTEPGEERNPTTNSTLRAAGSGVNTAATGFQSNVPSRDTRVWLRSTSPWLRQVV